MTPFPSLTEQTVETLVGAKSFKKGRSYVEYDLLEAPRRQGMTLKARCEEPDGKAYRVEVVADQRGGIARAACTCASGRGLSCAHIAGVLLAWVSRPDSFTELPEIGPALEQRSKPELIALIRQMLAEQPEMELYLAGPRGASPAIPPVDGTAYTRRVNAVFRRIAPAWNSERQIAAEVVPFVNEADARRDMGEFTGAAVIYAALAGAVSDHYMLYKDYDGDLANIIEACVKEIDGCLPGVTDGATHAKLLTTLLEVYDHTLEREDELLHDLLVKVIGRNVRPPERANLAKQIRAQLKAWGETDAEDEDFVEDDEGGLFGYRLLLLDLEADRYDDEHYMKLARQMDATYLIVERLLQRGRVDEAVAEFAHEQYDPLDVADRFVRHGHAELAERLIEERLRSTTSVVQADYAAWLQRRRAARGDRAGALEMALQRFRSEPSLEGYQEVRALARAADRWEALHPELHAFLRDKKFTAVLARVYLDEGDIEAALALVSVTKPTEYGVLVMTASIGHPQEVVPNLHLEIAQAAEATHPREALEIERTYVRHYIEARGRISYQAAADLLVRIRALYERLGEDAAWNTYIADIAETNKRLPALMDELRQAKLVK